MPTRFLINQCQIITILILKSDITENSRIELREIVLPVPSNQIKVTFIYGTPEGTFPFRYLSEKKLKQGNLNGNQNKKYLV